MQSQLLDTCLNNQVTLSQKASMIEQTPWALDLTGPQNETFASYFDVYDIPGNTLILKEGERQTPFMGIIIKGKVSVGKIDDQGNIKQVSTILKGRAFGEMSLIDGYPSSASITTLEQVKLMAMTQDKFKQLMDSHPKLGNNILLKLAQLISHRLRQTSGKLVDLL